MRSRSVVLGEGVLVTAKQFWDEMSDLEVDELKNLDYGGLPVLHLFYQYHTIGGVESILTVHHGFDEKIGIRSDTIVYREEATQSEDRVHCLGIRTDEPVFRIGRKLRAVTDSRSERLAIYHLPWGFRFLCPHDCAHRRILLLHGQLTGLERFIERNIQFMDGVMCVNRQIRESFESIAAGFPADRLIEISSPIRPAPGSRSSEGISKPLQVGYIGRLAVQHKRIDRLPGFCAELAKVGLAFQMSAIGDGPERALIDGGKSANTRVTGILQGKPYWEAVRGLDVLVFFSDTEGTPISLLEALSQGVIPVYPKIQSGGDSYVAEVSDELLFPPGDLAAAARIVQRLTNKTGDQIAALRRRCRKAVEKHSVGDYLRSCFDFTRKIGEMPRISTSNAGWSMKLVKFLTLEQIDAMNKFVGKIRR